LFVVVKHDIRRGRLHAELAEHADDLAAVQRAMVHDMHHDLPGGKAGVTDKARFEGHLPGYVGIGGRTGPGFPLGLQASVFLAARSLRLETAFCSPAATALFREPPRRGQRSWPISSAQFWTLRPARSVMPASSEPASLRPRSRSLPSPHHACEHLRRHPETRRLPGCLLQPPVSRELPEPRCRCS
jgi:hypothetical protein